MTKELPDDKVVEVTEKALSGEKKRARLSGVDDDSPDAAPITVKESGMMSDYYVLPEEDRKKGFIRPVRHKYIHNKCGSVTRMGAAFAETYARDPKYYTSTFCVNCGAHFPVGPDGEFIWDDNTRTKVGT